jgi:hypothetical protein
MATVLMVSRHDLDRPWLAAALVAAALVVTAVDTALLRTDAAALLRPGPLVAELAVAAALVLGDGWAYGPHHAFSTSQALGSVWPLAGILGAGVALGPLAAAGAGVAIGMARVGATVANGAAVDTGGRILSLINTVVFYALGGAAAGYVARLLRRAESQISAARAREEVARTLHDGVLQFVARGHTYKEIGATLFIAEKTVENHVRNILGKLHLNRKQELIRYALEHGIE